MGKYLNVFKLTIGPSSFLFFLLIYISSVQSQTYRISGTVTAENVPVKNAQVIFTLINDTTKQFFTLTDSLGNYFLEVLITSVDKNKPVIPSSIELAQNYPNPFSNTTEILYKLNSPGNINLVIYDILGQKIRTFQLGERISGLHEITWDGTNDFNQKVSPGVYFYQLQKDSDVLVKKMVYDINTKNIQIPTISINPGKSLTKTENSENNIAVKVMINNLPETEPQIIDSIFSEITISDNIILDFTIEEKPYLHSYVIEGNLSTDLIPVKYACLRFINSDDSTNQFLTTTDTSGDFQFTLSTYLEPFKADIEITNSDSTSPRIYNQFIEDILIQSDTTLNVKADEIESVTMSVRGRITARIIPVKYAEVTFANIADTSRRFSAITDSLGWYSLSIETYLPESIFNVEIRNMDDSEPNIFDYIYKNVNIENDTTLDDIFVDEIGPWVKYRPDVNARLWDIDFADSLNGWVVGAGIILHSTDGGETWHEQVSPVNESLLGVDFIDNKNGWICGRHSILKTTDGGENWQIKFYEDLDDGSVRDIEFVNDNIGFAVGGKGFLGATGILLKTSDGGENWEDMAPQSAGTLQDISIDNEQNIWVCGLDGTILLTNDMGITWTTKGVNGFPYPFTAIQFLDRNNGWIGCDDDIFMSFFRTADGGNSWIRFPYEGFFFAMGVQSIFFIDSVNGWLAPVVGAGSASIMNTHDGGQTWEGLPEGSNIDFVKSLCFINDHLGWGVGNEIFNRKARGVILRYKK